MEIRENATYPYPIWGLHEDFNGQEPDGTYKMYLDEASNEFVLDYAITVENEGIKRLIAEEKATYKCVVECVPTYFLLMQEEHSPIFQVRIPANKVHKRITAKVLVIATKDIDGCDYLDVNEIYEGIVDYPKGGVVAYIDNLSFDLQQKDNDTDLSRIFRTKAADVQRVEYSVNDKHIVIKYPKESKTAFESVEGNCPAVIEAAFVFPALVYALSLLPQKHQSDMDWVYYLKNIVDDYCSKNNMDIPENYKMEIDEIYDIANAVLSKVHTILLDETKKVIDQALED